MGDGWYGAAVAVSKGTVQRQLQIGSVSFGTDFLTRNMLLFMMIVATIFVLGIIKSFELMVATTKRLQRLVLRAPSMCLPIYVDTAMQTDYVFKWWWSVPQIRYEPGRR